MEQELLIYACALSRTFIYKWKEAKRLLEEFDSIEDLFHSSRKQLLHIMPHGELYVDRLLSPVALDEAKREIEWHLKRDIVPLFIEDRRYPERLKECIDAPVLLFEKGNCSLNGSRFLSIVGTRAATPYGKECCRKIIEYLSHCAIKPVIVSGLAYGIDASAHNAAIEFGLDTIAVMGTGFNHIYPPRHTELSEKIMQSGALVSDFCSDAPAFPHNFVSRNRIIAGMCDGLLVCESRSKGGSLISALMAGGYDREVFAIPGKVCDPTSSGCNKLIEDEVARIALGGESIARVLCWDDSSPAIIDCNSNYDDLRGTILTILSQQGPLDADELSEKLKISPQELSLPLIKLEMDKKIAIFPSNKFGTI